MGRGEKDNGNGCKVKHDEDDDKIMDLHLAMTELGQWRRNGDVYMLVIRYAMPWRTVVSGLEYGITLIPIVKRKKSILWSRFISGMRFN